MSSVTDYLVKKKALEESIQWYSKTISEVEKQQSVRRQKYFEIQNELYKLERDFYGYEAKG